MARAALADVALTCPVTYDYTRASDHDPTWFLGGVLERLLADSGLDKDAIDGVAAASLCLHPDSVAFLAQHFELSPRWCEQLPFGGASGVIAAQRAARAVQAGDAEVVACLAGDSTAGSSFADLAGNFSRFSNRAAYPYGAAGPNLPFALITRAYMERHGADREDFGRLVLSQRHNAAAFAPALLGAKALDMAGYLAARPICEPLHLLDCVMPCSGGEGFLVMRVERAEALGLPWVRLLASEERHNAYREDPIQLRGAWELFRDALYDSAGVEPGDIDLLYTYDDYPVISLLQVEGLGFCDAGEGARWARETDLRFDGGGLPHNTSGGQLSCGQAGAAGGFLGIVEALRQLTGAALGNPVAGARNAVVSGFGMINYDRGVCASAAVLERGHG